MWKAILTSVVALSLFSIGTATQAEIIKYQCNIQSAGIGAVTGTLRIDTKTLTSAYADRAVQFSGSITINPTTIYFSSDCSDKSQINRATGAYTDSDGDTGTCRRLK